MDNRQEVARQYADGENLNTRIAFQQRFSRNTYGFSRWLMDQYVFAENARVLEIGCGTGNIWKGKESMVSGFARLALTDFSAGMLQEARENLHGMQGVEFLQADIQNLPFEPDSFDFVIANMMLYHVEDKRRALQEVRRVLRPGGTFVCATYGEVGLPSYMGEMLRGIVQFRPLNATFTLQNGEEILRCAFAQIERRDYPDEFVVDDPEAIIGYLQSMTGMIVEGGGDFPADEVRALLQERIAQQGALHIPKQYGTFVCR